MQNSKNSKISNTAKSRKPVSTYVENGIIISVYAPNKPPKALQGGRRMPVSAKPKGRYSVFA